MHLLVSLIIIIHSMLFHLTCRWLKNFPVLRSWVGKHAWLNKIPCGAVQVPFSSLPTAAVWKGHTHAHVNSVNTLLTAGRVSWWEEQNKGGGGVGVAKHRQERWRWRDWLKHISDSGRTPGRTYMQWLQCGVKALFVTCEETVVLSAAR